MLELLAITLAIAALVQVYRSRQSQQDLAQRLSTAEGLILKLAGGENISPEDIASEKYGSEPPRTEGLDDRPDLAAPTEESKTPDAPRRAEAEHIKSEDDVIRADAAAGAEAQRDAGVEDAGEHASPSPSLEETLGTRWAVWVGGLALALGGLMLVRYSIEQGLFGPAARIGMGALFSALLIGAGEWFRRSKQNFAVSPVPSAHIPAILTAAGTSSAFGTIYAAHALYGFIGPVTAFALLGAVAITAMLAAALHGPALAGLGLAGSYAVPLLITSSQPNPWAVVIYLAAVAFAAMGLANIRNWLWLALLAIVGVLNWGLLLAVKIPFASVSWSNAALIHCLVQMLLTAFFIAYIPNAGTKDEDALPDWIGSLSVAALGALALLLLSLTDLAQAQTLSFAIAAISILMATAYLAAPTALSAIIGGTLALAVAVLWPNLTYGAGNGMLWQEVAPYLKVPTRITSYFSFITLLSMAVMSATLLRLWRGSKLPTDTAGLYALTATATPLITLIIAYLRVTQFDHSIQFTIIGLVLAFIFTFITDRLMRRENPDLAATRLATGAFATAALAALSFALVVWLDRGYLTVALGLSALGAAYIATSKDIPMLRHAVTGLALIVLARIGWDPRIMDEEVGQLPIFNWLLIGYGIPAASFWISARMLEAKGPTLSARIADAVAILLIGLLCFFEIHHALNGGDVFAKNSGHVELGLMALVSLGFSYALMRLNLASVNPVFHYASLAFGTISVCILGFGLALFQNPLFAHDQVTGIPFLSSLGIGYLLPGLAATLLARASKGHRPRWFVIMLAAFASLAVFGFITLEVRHIFHGPYLNLSKGILSVEQWAYSVSWLLLGLGFLAYGLWRHSLEARLASAALVLLSVAKVFFIDLNGLTGLWRALSFIVLGCVLIGIGWVYQNYVFANRQPKAKANDANIGEQ